MCGDPCLTRNTSRTQPLPQVATFCVGVMPGKLTRFVSKLTITQGDGLGELFVVHDHQEKLLDAIEIVDGDIAFSVARGDGKSTLIAAVAVAAFIGPLAQSRGETVIVASSFEQALIIFNHVMAFMREMGFDLTPNPKNRFRVRNSQSIAKLEDRETGTMVRCIGSDPRRAHGIAPYLVMADEPAQWEPTKRDAMFAALRTSMGKIPNSRLIAIGTRPESTHHPFQKMLDGGAAFSMCYAAEKDDDPFDTETWLKANPSLPSRPSLQKVIEREAEDAKIDPALLAGFKSLRLNMGTSDTLRNVLLDADTWTEAEGQVDPTGARIFGIDLGSTEAMSAASCVWGSGRLEALAAFPSLPDLEQRERADAVPGLYTEMAAAEELVQLGYRTVPPCDLLEAAIKRWGVPDVIVADRWRISELFDAMDQIGLDVPFVERGQGFKDGAEDVRRFRTLIVDKIVRPVPSLLLRAAMAEATVVCDAAGNEKLAKNVEGGRRSRGRDDAVAASILAVAELHRQREADAAAGPVAMPMRIAV